MKKKIDANALSIPALRARKVSRKSPPSVGIFWIFKRSLISFMEPVSHVQEEAGFKSGSYDHYPAWAEAQRKCSFFLDREYDEVPRGRVVYDIKADMFFVYANEKVLKQFAAKILAEFALPADKTQFVLDAHYSLKRS